jgi:endonuclease-3
MTDLLGDRALHVQLVHQALVRTYGERTPHEALDPLSELVLTILSQHTSDVNSHRAYTTLRATFPSWEDVLEAPTERVVEAIRSGGLANQKAPRIQQILREVREQDGRLSLDGLCRAGVPAARERLTALHGVGSKTASCVLLFSCGLPAFPVDTHIHRVTRRLGIAPEKATPDGVQHIVEAVLPDAETYSLHVLLITHGRQVCRAQVPRCGSCSLRHLCLHGQAQEHREGRGRLLHP